MYVHRRVDPKLDFGGGGASDSFHCLFHVRSFLTPLFAIGNITVWEGPWSCGPFGSPPVYTQLLICHFPFSKTISECF